ncbi:DUF4280 domain-containing protein [Azospirillum melinis]|uniref:DUF4280 domain-containing protein n=1 Tax=Azospirillum TaxID=191 RepID=UPI000D61B137|nr:MULTISPECIES: DUF4280 domain-containing protein [unclassified Azospirillum]PWC49818.1 hypothetical protein TSA6c_27585 [Azospirillum sp. TSA6c]PWC78615.1 hypothetical protein TSH64_31250 [Azospirillum sp. TSH64]
MGMQAVMGAMTMCSFGAAPSSLMVLPASAVMSSKVPAANIMDSKPFVNVLPFGVCMSMANPAVAAATAAAFGVLTPMPCTPMTAAPWVPGSPTVLVGKMPALNNSSKCMCAFGGVIQITLPGQFTEMVP